MHAFIHSNHASNTIIGPRNAAVSKTEEVRRVDLQEGKKDNKANRLQLSGISSNKS
jgi:hypothetical protein